MSNAKWLEKVVDYRTVYGLGVVKEIISQKIKYQFDIIKSKKLAKAYINKIKTEKDSKTLLLIEARAAKQFWKIFGGQINGKTFWFSRNLHHDDVVNKLLDVGYHFLVQKVAKIFEEHDVPYEIGFLHKAQSKNAKPLVYDFIEWLRPIIVDATLLKFLHRKKKLFEHLDKKSIPHFIFEIKKSCKKSFYHKHLKYCVTLDYWISLNVLAMRSAVTENRRPKFYFPSLRHETRCRKPPEGGSQ